MLVNGFDWIKIIILLSGYISIHYVWPKEKASDSLWYELIEFVVELPFRAIAYLVRLIGRFFGHSDGDIGLDL
ncbi:hypothetical protein CXF74_14280 [Psychromonas sp. Urea-02u-13]|nr:hypothetical protein CXF74_14280 [Psychromonas sp. Urea-02u-13]